MVTPKLPQTVLSACFFSACAFGESTESNLFRLDTRTPTVTSSATFTANTTTQHTQVTSATFTANTTIQHTQVTSGSFISDTMTVPVDTDGDGLPNIWEARYFEGTTSGETATDSDKDGASNLAEYITGTSPLDTNSLFRIQFTDAGISWPTILNRNYSLQSTTNISMSFTHDPIHSDVPGTGSNMNFPWPTAAKDRAFYRVNVNLP